MSSVTTARRKAELKRRKPMNQRAHPPGRTDRLPKQETVQLTESEFRACLSALVRQAGSIAALSARLGINGQFWGDVIAGRKHAGKKVLGCFNARMVWMIELPIMNGSKKVTEKREGPAGAETPTSPHLSTTRSD